MSKRRTKLRGAEAATEAALDMCPDPVCIIGSDGYFKQVNAAMRKATGYSKAKLLGIPYLQLVHPDDHEATLREVERFKGGKVTRGFENRIRCNNDSYKLFSWACRPLAGGKLAYAAAREITDLKRAEEAVRESEENYRNLFEQANDAICLVQDGRVKFANAKFTRMLGYSFNEALSKPLSAFVSADLSGKLAECGSYKAIGQTQPHVTEGSLKRRDGSELHAEVSIGQTTYGGDPARLVFIKDITIRTRAEKALRESEARYRAVVEDQTDLICRFLPDGTLTFVNEAYCRYFGKKRDEVLGQRFGAFGAEPNRQFFRRLTASPARISPRSAVRAYEQNVITASGSAAWVQWTIRAILDDRGEVDHFQAIGRDITDRKRAGKQQALTNRLLERLNKPGDLVSVLRSVINSIKNFLGVEAVGIRLRHGDDFPYFVSKGFPGSFIKAESSLCAKAPDGEIIRDETCKPYLECLCGNILSKRTDPSKPFFTEGGSFWTNSTTGLLAETSEKDRLARTRNRCNTAGYESVALVPIRAGDEIIGLLQFNDTRPNFFKLDTIRFFEQVGTSIGMGIRRHQAEEALRESEEKARALMNATTDSAFLVDRDGKIIAANQTAAQRFGKNVEEILGTCVFDLMPPEVAKERKAAMEQVARSGQPVRFQDERAGMTFDNAGYPVLDAKGKVVQFAVFSRDITGQKQTQAALKKLNETLEHQVQQRTAIMKLLQDVAVIANEAVLVEEALRAALARICQYLGWPLGHAWEVKDGESGTLADTGIWYTAAPEQFRQFLRAKENTRCLGGDDWAWRAASSGKPAWTTDVGKIKGCERREPAARAGIRAAFAIPVIVGGRVGAVLEFFSPQPPKPSDPLRSVATHIGTQLGRVLERRQLQQQLIDAVWQEQCRFGQELHDGLCQQVTSIGMLAEILLARLESRSAAEAELAANILDAVQVAKEQASALAKALHPAQIDPEALPFALEELTVNTERLYGLKCTFTCEQPMSLKKGNVANHLFRIAQEAIRNACKHSRASNIVLSLADNEDALRLEVSDNGVGIDAQKLHRASGVGLRIMQYRAQTIGATLDIRPNDKGGTVVTCLLKHRQEE